MMTRKMMYSIMAPYLGKEVKETDIIAFPWEGKVIQELTDEEEEIDDGIGESKSSNILLPNSSNLDSYQIHLKSTKIQPRNPSQASQSKIKPS